MRPCYRLVLIILSTWLLSACAATTHIKSTQDGATIDIKTSTQNAAPRIETYQSTTFGNYEFRAQANESDPFFGILPLKFNGGYLAIASRVIMFQLAAGHCSVLAPYCRT